MLPAGRLPLDLMATVQQLADDYGLKIYLTTAQNLRLLNIAEDKIEQIKTILTTAGATLKAPGKFPLPKVCIGKNHCKLGLIDCNELSLKLLAKFGSRQQVKAKFKIAISACVLACSGHKIVDIGIGMTKNGYEVFVGGKGGSTPKIGRRIARNLDESEVLAIVETLVDFHDKHTVNKQRIYKLLPHPDFPYPDAV
jgi:dissimilatory sulfite reductase (desulfoviridin) alpha/beta subunit